MKTEALQGSPEYYKGYINLVEGNKSLIDLLENGGTNLFRTHFETLELIGEKVYAEGKWTIKEIVQHLIDTERIFVNRALRFVRCDQTELPGYDHNAYVPVSNANKRTLESLLEEYEILRLSTFSFFKQLNLEELQRTGIANGNEISVLAIGFILIGHPTHHFNVIKERYFSLA